MLSLKSGLTDKIEATHGVTESVKGGESQPGLSRALQDIAGLHYVTSNSSRELFSSVNTFTFIRGVTGWRCRRLLG